MVQGGNEFQQRFGRLAGELGETRNIEILFRHLHERRVMAGDVILRHGETDDTLYLIAEGRLVLSVNGADERPIQLGYYGAGQWVGEAGFLDAQPALLDVICEREGVLLTINRDGFDGLITTAPAMAGALLRSLSLSMVEQLRECIRPASHGELEPTVNDTAQNAASREAACISMLRQLHHLDEVQT